MRPKNLRVVPTDAPQAPTNDDVDLPDKAENSEPDTSSEVNLPDQKGQLESTWEQVSGTDADQSAKIINFSDQSGYDPRFIAANLPQVEKAAAAPPSSFFDRIEAEYPGTTKFLSDPKNMAATHDDVGNVVAHEGIIEKLKSAWGSLRGSQEEAPERGIAETFEHAWQNIQDDDARQEARQQANLQAVKSGFQLGGIGYTARLANGEKGLPEGLTENAPMEQRLLSQVGSLISDFPTMTGGAAVGGVAGASAGALAGATLGSIVPGIGTLMGAGIGALALGGVGSGAGAFAFPAAVNQGLIDAIQKGDIKSFSDLYERASSMWDEFKKGAKIGALTGIAGEGLRFLLPV